MKTALLSKCKEAFMDLLEKVKAAGVIGAGGAGFPTHVKLQSSAEYILLNGAECEPLLRVDQQLMEVYPEKIITGLYLAGKQVGAKKAIIGIKNKHAKVIDILKNSINKLDLNDEVYVHELPDIYPAGDEQVLVYEITGRVVPELGIPIAVGCVVINTETALNIFNAAQEIPVTEKYVTVTGAVPKPITVKVPVGTPLKELFSLSGVKSLQGFAVIDGGPMMGPLLENHNEFVTKKTKGLIILPESHSLIGRKSKSMESARVINRTACEQCRMCTDLCPRALLGHSTSPHKMVMAMAYNMEASEAVTVAQTCCQCNLCDYFSCPAGINPKMANVFYMTKLREQGIRHTTKKDTFEPKAMRKYRLVPSKRLIARLDIKQYDKAAPLCEDIDYTPELVGIHTNTHVGAPAVAVVKAGDKVNAGDVIGTPKEGALGTNVHASIDGIVESVENNIIVIRRC